ncbi:glycerol-3-phosphate 1-O-acyltransferase PlsY [Methylocella silvestris]|uniref:Glycerol-3-phosphate acyltransferase n=1 Tax=Methylocella silvestris TaxID=199596 RepID=A0A2J7TMD1_METSI|nr:glycerol-3-phosphate 1-O-acyltransferase PlsY [Methylocella silvestris]PNG27867.1 glycerol-3-phosphate acyltransferase [Methylocella silvestris]
MILSVLALLFGYLCGSIPFGLILTSLSGVGNLRTVGSGNIGATNVLRTGRKDLAAATLLLDLAKGAVAVLIVSFIATRRLPPLSAWPPAPVLAAALGAFLGHIYPVWLGFKGGKGVATYLGCLLAVAWPAGLAFIAAWLGVAFLTRYSSLAALIAAALTPVVLLALHQTGAAILFAGMSALIFWKHRENIARLKAGAETKIGKK